MPLYSVTSLQDPLINLLADDPVRVEIPADFRISADCEVLVLQNEDTLEPEAVVCVAYRDSTPADILELAREPLGDITTAVFYTIWSYRSGAGRRMIRTAVNYIKRTRPSVREFVTLSPQTDMARRFHLSNGAAEWRVNGDTVNYLYSDHTESHKTLE
jgi:hypothetical protein